MTLTHASHASHVSPPPPSTPASHWPRHFFLVDAHRPEAGGEATRESMGGKAHNLLRMAAIGMPVPPALVIGTHYARHAEDCMLPLFSVALPALQEACGQALGDTREPLLVSVRSGAPVSMPGMLETLLNVGLCDATVPGLLRQTGNPRLVWDSYRRLVASHAEVVHGAAPRAFETRLDEALRGRDERELDFSELRELTRAFQDLHERETGQPFPQDPAAQLSGAVRAVFASWNAGKALSYREINHIDAAMGTAVTIQRMVFGNAGGHSGAGVGFTRDPTSGRAVAWVDFLPNAQGEDVVSGRRDAHGHQALEQRFPGAWARLLAGTHALEREFGDMQDFEFTVQEGRLHMLQTRAGKRTPLAAARIALDLLDEGLIDAAEALRRVQSIDEADIGTRGVAAGDAQAGAAVLAHAASACPGIVSGEIVLDDARARQRVQAGAQVLLLRQDAQTEDIAALDLAVGLLTSRGARTSHAAVVARQLGKVCLVGCADMVIDMQARELRLGGQRLAEGEHITLDGNEGCVYRGEVASVWRPDESLLARLRALRAGQATHQATHQATEAKA